MIDIVTPTLWRSSRLEQYVANVHANTTVDHVLTFAVEDDDPKTLAVLDRLAAHDPTVRYIRNTGTKNVHGAYNTAIAEVTAPYWFASGDDVNFHPGWDTACLALMVDPVKVVGTNDLLNRNVLNGQTATHFLVDTRYIAELGGTFDETPGIAAFEGYGHDYFDTELVEVAKSRDAFAPCLEAVVEHMHYLIGKAVKDATYERNVAAAGGDSRIFTRRRDEWLARKAAA